MAKLEDSVGDAEEETEQLSKPTSKLTPAALKIKLQFAKKRAKLEKEELDRKHLVQMLEIEEELAMVEAETDTPSQSRMTRANSQENLQKMDDRKRGDRAQTKQQSKQRHVERMHSYGNTGKQINKKGSDWDGALIKLMYEVQTQYSFFSSLKNLIFFKY